jgi:hypothetical protein
MTCSTGWSSKLLSAAPTPIATRALDQATKAAADVLAEQLQAYAPRMLHEHRDFRRGFEQRLQRRWGSPLGLYETVRVCCLEAGEDFRKRYQLQNVGSDCTLASGAGTTTCPHEESQHPPGIAWSDSRERRPCMARAGPNPFWIGALTEPPGDSRDSVVV